MGSWFLKTKQSLKKVPIHPTFVLFFLWFVLTKNISAFFIFATVILTHEFGHYIVAKKLGYKLDSFFIAPYGVSLNYKERAFDSKDEVLIALAGPAVNLCLSLVIVSLWWIAPDIYNYSHSFVMQSTMLGLFNLLPCYPLDGGRIMVGLLQNYISRERAVKLTSIFNFIFSFIMLLLFFISCFIDFNPSLCLFGCFLIMGIIDSKYESKYQPIALFKKQNKNFSKPIFLTVDCNTTILKLLRHIEINKMTIFVVTLKGDKVIFLDEGQVKKLSLKYPVNTSLEKILKQEKE